MVKLAIVSSWQPRHAPLCVPLSPTVQVAEFPTSGLIFRDTVKIIELNDDKGEVACPAMPTVLLAVAA